MTILMAISALLLRLNMTLSGAIFGPLLQAGNPICDVYTALQAWALPLAFVGLLVIFLIWIARPLAPELYAQQQGAIRSVAIGIAGVALTPTILAFLATTFNLSNSAACGS